MVQNTAHYITGTTGKLNGINELILCVHWQLKHFFAASLFPF